MDELKMLRKKILILEKENNLFKEIEKKLHATNQQLQVSGQQLKSNQETLLQTQKIARVGSWEWNVVTDTVTWSNELFHIFKINPEHGSVSYADHPKIYTPASMLRLDTAVQDTLATGESYEIDLEIKKTDGTNAFCTAWGCAEKDEKGKVVRLYGSLQDITERKQMEEELLKNQERYKKAQAMGQVANWEYDPVSEKFWASDEAKRIYGYDISLDDFSTEMVESCIPERKRVHNALIDLLEQNKEYDLVFDILTYDKGIRKTLHSIAEIERDSKGNPKKITGVINDITKRKKTEDNLKALNKQLIANEQQLRASNQQLQANEQQLKAANQQLSASEQQLRATNQQLQANEQQLKAANQQLEANEKRLIDANKKLVIAKQKIEKSEKYLENIIENIADPIFVKDEDSKLLIVNNAFCQLFELNKENIIGKTLAEDVSPEERESFLRIDKIVLSSGIENVNEETLTLRGGLTKTIATKKSRFLDEKGNKFLVGVIRDITARKLIEKNLEESLMREKLQANIVRNSPIAIAFGYPDGRLANCNKAFISLCGYSEEELIKIDWNKTLTPPKWNKIEAEELKKLSPKNNSITYKKEYIHKNGIIIPIELIVTARYDENENLIHFIGFINDITEREKAETELLAAKEKAQESEEKYKALYDNAPLSYQSLNEDGSFIDVNPTWLSTLGYKREEVIGKFYKDFLHPNWQDHFEKNFPAFKKRGYVSDVQFKLKHKKGHYIDISFEGCIGYHPDGSFKQTYCVFQDITEKKRALDELVIAKEKAEESDRLKSAFLANMSHEIRTPMNGILGFTSLLQEPNLTGEKQQNYIEIIQKSGDRMLNTVNDIIDISRIESGQIELSFSEVNIYKQLHELYLFFKPEAAKHNTKLIIKNEIIDQDFRINTDPEKLNSILTNLIKNAIKFTDKGTIEMGYQLKNDSGNNYVEFYVKDTGMGIEKDRQAAIFDRFIQADIEDKHAKQGSGLGLAISKAYAEMLGGEIWLESQVGLGSTFYFTTAYNSQANLKFYRENNGQFLNETISSEKLKILITEDDETSDMLISIMLQEINREILHAKNGLDAIEFCRNNPDIDLIFMDIKMPTMDGHETTRQIRQFNKDVIIIAQTAYGLSGDKEKAIAAGCNDYVSKPINKEKLLEIISSHF